MSNYILNLQNVDKERLSIVGGKGANLGELSRIAGLRVPEGFCVTTDVYKQIIASNGEVSSLLHQLGTLRADDRKGIAGTSARIRKVIEELPVPKSIINEIKEHLEQLGEGGSYAVRSSATAEDLPTSSFAGQQDTYLNIVGKDAILKHISKCWASLFTDRAIAYRMQNGFDHKKVYLSVIIQKMVFADVSGIMFTADPVSSDRKVVSIDASFGLGEALVSGIVNADNYKIRDGKIIHKQTGSKKLAIYAAETSGTRQQPTVPAQQDRHALSDRQIRQLETLGRTIEAHFGHPQDIEWCLVGEEIYIVQSRPITTLYPIPEARDENKHVYVSVGHQQMMTDAMKPLGLSFWLLTTSATMRTAGGRLFVDVAPMLASRDGRDTLLNVLGKSDPLIRAAFTSLMERSDFKDPIPDDKSKQVPAKSPKPPSLKDFQTLKDYDREIVSDLIRRNEASINKLKEDIAGKSGLELLDSIHNDIQHIKKIKPDPESFGVVMTSMNALYWINEKMNEWLGEKNAGDAIAQSVPHNVTSEMGLALLDVADVIRPYPPVVAFLHQVKDDNFLDKLPQLEGGKEVRDAIYAYLDKYGMRCAGEIDITRDRWSEKPSTIISVILSHIKNFKPGEGKRKFEQGRQEAMKKEQELLQRLKQLPDGEQKAREAKRMIDLVRNFAGYREYPKYTMICRYFVYKQALLREADRLVHAGVIREKEDVYYLSFEELREVVVSGSVDDQLISKRKEEYEVFQKLSPPRVMTSDGEVLTGQYNREHLPDQAIPGLPVSAGVVEGRARVILNMEDAELEDGDILVTAFTDPSWTPLFVSIKGLVTEVGGLMTHGAVIAREYGLPAVVGVENATTLIKDGQQIRVNGTEGYVVVNRESSSVKSIVNRQA